MPKIEGKQKQVNVTLDPQVMQFVEEQAPRLGLSISSFIRMKLREVAAREAPKPFDPCADPTT